MSRKTPKIVIIGLDAAVEHLLLPWVREGKLPNIARCMEEGVQGQMESVIQPLTPPAWTAFMTGKNSGKNGIFNFLQYSPESYEMVYTNGGSRKAESIWKMFNRAGLTVGVMNTPYTYPPEKLDGFQISGFDTPSSDSAFFHPPELKKEMEDRFGKLQLDARYLGAMTNLKKRAEAFEEMKASDEQWLKMALYLIDNYPQDVMMFTFMSIDTVQHHFWHYMDASHHYYDAEGAKQFSDAILKVYQRLDAAVGSILAKLDLSKTHVFICSDHGQEGVSDRTIFANRILSQAGLLTYKPLNPFKAATLGLARPFLTFLRKTMTSGQKKVLSSLFPKLRDNADGISTSFAEIDWSKTQAYANESLSSPPCISINMKGQKPEGIVEQKDYEAVMAKVCAAIEAVKDPRDGTTVVQQVYRREELYSGPYSHWAPDLTLKWWGDSQFNARPSLRSEDHLPPIVVDPSKPLTDPEWSGHHTIDGILIARGAGIKKSANCRGARLIDMAPTLHYLLNLPVPSDMDGRVLLELFEAEAQKDVVSGAASEEPVAVGNGIYSDAETALVEERLKNLGYLD
jgi:predicted AlkP superfamily phosphohydrolase/phosphomutase